VKTRSNTTTVPSASRSRSYKFKYHANPSSSQNPACRNKSSSTYFKIRVSYTTEITQSALFSGPSLATGILNQDLHVQTIESHVFYYLGPMLMGSCCDKE